MSTTQEKTDRQLVYNAVRCLECNRLLESTFRHDYKTCGCYNQAMVDGGLAYQRWGGRDMSKVKSIAVYADEPFELVRNVAYRFNQKGEQVRLKDMSSDWLENAIAYELEMHANKDWHITLLIREKQHRFEKDIFIEDTAIEGKDYITPKEYTEALKKESSPKSLFEVAARKAGGIEAGGFD